MSDLEYFSKENVNSGNDMANQNADTILLVQHPLPDQEYYGPPF